MYRLAAVRERLGRAASGIRPHSIQARVALAIAVALAVAFVAVQVVFGTLLESRAHDRVERALEVQADAIALAIDRAGVRNAAATAQDAQRFLGDTQAVVRVAGEVVFWNDPVRNLEARGTATRGDIEVTLERADPSAGTLSDWRLSLLFAFGVIGIGVMVWWLAAGVSRRLRRSVGELADSAEEVTRGNFEVRVAEDDDELGRLAQAFNRMAARLEAADLRQREFLADVAHELRTPVTAIEGFATALADGTARSEEDRAESAEFIRAEAARLRELVRDLHKLTWLDLDPPARAVQIDLHQLAQAAVARQALDATLRGVQLSGPEGRTTPATGDPEHVATILSNLISNALTATPSGGSVLLRLESAPGLAGVAVEDDGCGIAPEHLPYIFDRLYRVAGGRGRESGGSGLGLSIVRRLAAIQNGHVNVQSVVDEGTVFTLWLPASRQRRASAGSRVTGGGRIPSGVRPGTAAGPRQG